MTKGGTPTKAVLTGRELQALRASDSAARDRIIVSAALMGRDLSARSPGREPNPKAAPKLAPFLQDPKLLPKKPPGSRRP